MAKLRKTADVDPLSDVLRVLQLSGAILFRAEMASPWAFSIPDSRTMAAAMLPGATRLMRFHIVLGGECFVLQGGQPTRLTAGNVVLLARGDPHTMCSSPEVPAVPVLSVLPELRVGDMPRLVFPGTGPVTTLFCGFLGCAEPIFDPLAAALPPFILESRAFADPDSWLGSMLGHLSRRSGSDSDPGEPGMNTRFVELMFIEVLRRYIAGLGDDQKGWLAGLRDPQIARALSELHADPGHPWTVANLAKTVGLSRSVLAARFRAVAGLSPMQYLAAWRLQVAASLLKSGTLPISEASARVGYQSEAAFHRAFKRFAGEPPASWRRKLG